MLRLESAVGLNLGQQIVETTKAAEKMRRWEKTVSKTLDTLNHRAFVEEVP